MAEISLNKELQKIIDDIAEVAQYLWEKGWAERNAGNITVDITELVPKKSVELTQFTKIPMEITLPELAGRYFLVTTTGKRCRDLAREPEKSLLIVRIADELDGYRIFWGGEGPESRPTSEFLPHLKIHVLLRQSQSPQKVVLHSHPSHLIALTSMEDFGRDTFNRFLWSTHVAANFFLPEGVGMVPFSLEEKEEMGEITADLLKQHKAVLWEKHGCITTGIDVNEAFDLMDILNKAAEVFLIGKSAGYEPEIPE
jgi:rhamnulose-1-phosphate aldolase